MFLFGGIVCFLNTTRNKVFISLSMVKVEHIAVRSCCTQLFWMKQMLSNYIVSADVLIVYYDNTSAINISKNPVLHSRTIHIDIKYHFIYQLVEAKIMELRYISTENQIVNIFANSLDAKRFENLRNSLELCCIYFFLSFGGTFFFSILVPRDFVQVTLLILLIFWLIKYGKKFLNKSVLMKEIFWLLIL